LASARAEVLQALKASEVLRKPPLSELFTDVYDSLPPNLQTQQAQLLAHIDRYRSQYTQALDEFAPEKH